MAAGGGYFFFVYLLSSNLKQKIGAFIAFGGVLR
jgi:hypothetical protein